MTYQSTAAVAAEPAAAFFASDFQAIPIERERTHYRAAQAGWSRRIIGAPICPARPSSPW